MNAIRFNHSFELWRLPINREIFSSNFFVDRTTKLQLTPSNMITYKIIRLISVSFSLMLSVSSSALEKQSNHLTGKSFGESYTLLHAELIEGSKDSLFDKLKVMNESTIIHLKSTDTFLILSETDSLNQPGLESRPLGFYPPPRLKHKRQLNLKEFKVVGDLGKFKQDLWPISNCHEELAGEGGSVTLLTSFQHSTSSTVSFEISPNVILSALELTTKVSQGFIHNLAKTITCEVQHGEVVQAFIRGIRTLRYYLELREIVFDFTSCDFVGSSSNQISSVHEVQVGSEASEFVCATNTMKKLSCSILRDSIYV